MRKPALFTFLCFSFLCFGQAQENASLETQVDSLIRLNRTLIAEQSFDKAILAIEAAEELTQANPNALYAKCLYNHGRSYYYWGKPQEAVPHFQKALSIQEHDPGKEHGDYAYSLTGLANAFRELGRYEEAAPMYKESKDIRGAFFGKEHPAYAGALNNLALMYWTLGDYKNAEPLYLESKDIREKVEGRESYAYAASLDNLAILYMDMGQNEKAEKLYQESIALNKEVYGTNHPNHGNSLQNLANLYFNIERYDEAEPLYIESLSIHEKAYGKENEGYIVTMQNLANLYIETGDFEMADSLYNECMNFFDQSGDKVGKQYANALSCLGHLYWGKGEFEESLNYHKRSVQLNKQLLGDRDPSLNFFLLPLAETYQITKESDDAEKILVESLDLLQNNLRYSSTFLSEKELTEFSGQFEEQVDHIFNFMWFRNVHNLPGGRLPDVGYNNLLFYKGYLLTASRKLNTAATLNPETNTLFNELKSYRRRLAGEYTYVLQDRDQQVISELESKANDTEKKLVSMLSEFSTHRQKIEWRDLQIRLKPGEAAVEFIRFPLNFPKSTDSVMYAALVLIPEAEHPIYVPLFEEKQLTTLLGKNAEPNSTNNMSVAYARGLKPVKSVPSKALYTLLWEPIHNVLNGATKVYFAPAGLLHKISFDAIAIDKEQWLSDKIRLIRLGSTRSLVEEKGVYDRKGTGPALYGGIEYSGSAANHRAGWGYLKGTEIEVNSIASMMENKGYLPAVFSGANATEKSFKALTESGKSPRILHIATHGFFFPDPIVSSVQKKEPGFAFSSSANPLIRSGLLLAGANEAWEAGKKPEHLEEDGILTAYEISQMNLSNTELVVLSACETGLGDVQGNEGVYGLQRAFKIAGVNYIIMSLWKVPDQQTAELMTRFYSNWILDGMDIPEAFREAQKELRKKDPDPYLWAGFVLLE